VKDKDDEGDEKDKDKDKDKEEGSKDEEGEKDEEGNDEGEAEPAEGGEAGDAKKPEGKTGPSKPGTKKPGEKPTGSTGTKPPDPNAGKAPPPEKKPSGSENLDVDCILDPGLPKCKGGGGSKPSGGTKPPPTGSTDPGVEQTLSQADIKAGIAPVKDAAKACGPKHGAKPGEKVQVRLSISGSSGTVTSATAQGAHQGTPLGNCVAAALKKATFKKFAKASIGAVYPITM
jgi:hypothetical protein